ncbi:MAG TPA: apolipoprotein N-acyltransferase [Myxococcaceae bacterium]|nr:apolipoprotein N-acyltransferase [Myxococcaceae bacterium]
MAIALPDLAPSRTPPADTPAARGRLLTPARLGLLVLSGLLGAAALPLAFPVGPRRELFPGGALEPLAFVALLPLLWALRGLSTRKAFAAGLLAGIVFFNGTFWWVNVAMTSFGGMPNWLSIPALQLLVLYCALHWALAAWAMRMMDVHLGWSPGLTVGPTWMSIELLRNYSFSGYPWANLGYSQARNLWFSQIASLAGVYGVALALAVVNGALYEVLRFRLARERSFPRAPLLLAGGVLLGGHLYGAWHVWRWDRLVARAPVIRVAVVQGNIDQKLKMVQGSRSGLVLGRYLPATAAAVAAGAELVVWPEGSYPLAFPTGVTEVRGRGLDGVVGGSRVLVGVDVYDPRDLKRGNENAAFLVGPDLAIEHHYVKHHLVPYGEYIPLHMDEWLPIQNLVPGTFLPGDDLSPALLRRPGRLPVKVGIEICYDAIFPEISREFVLRGADILVNMTNDAWYGFSSANFQFLRKVAMRAVETGRPFARAANTGVSAFIDPLGRVSQATAIGLSESDHLHISAAELAGPEWRMADLPLLTARTPYVVIGDVPAYLAALLAGGGTLAALVSARRRGRRPAPTRT